MSRLVVENRTTRPTVEVDEIVRFAAARSDLMFHTHVRVGSSRDDKRTGYACSTLNGAVLPRGIGRAKSYVRCTVPGDDYPYYGIPKICGHSKRLRELIWEHGLDEAIQLVAGAYNVGQRKVGRWPIYIIGDWRELLVHLAAHELRHIEQFENRRSLSEIDCEEFALATLTAWRERSDQ